MKLLNKKREDRFKRFLDKSSIANGCRHDPAERASYFLWYHLRATREKDADLEIVQKYLEASGAYCPDLQELYQRLVGENQMVTCVSIPGRLRTRPNWNKIMDEEYEVDVFESSGLSPFYFRRAQGGRVVKISSELDFVKYWPQRSWIASWMGVAVGILGLVSLIR